MKKNLLLLLPLVFVVGLAPAAPSVSCLNVQKLAMSTMTFRQLDLPKEMLKRTILDNSAKKVAEYFANEAYKIPLASNDAKKDLVIYSFGSMAFKLCKLSETN